MCKPDPGLFHFINQGVLEVDGMDDKEEMRIAEVCIVAHTSVWQYDAILQNFALVFWL